MKYIKFKAFTLAEVMILLLTLSILMAAFAPVFTRRYNNAGADDVWAFVPSSNQGDAYYDTPNKNYTAQAFIGLTPVDGGAVRTFSSDASNNVLYSKIVVGASDKLGGTSSCGTIGSPECQKQIQFRYGNDEKGTVQGTLFAGKGNILLGGMYNNITSSATNNAGYGWGALRKISSGYNNAAIGADALQNLDTGHDNTAIGLDAGGYDNKGLVSGYSNTFVGTNAGNSVGSSVYYNTAIGNYSMQKITGNANTAMGFYSMSQGNGSAKYNTAIGYYSLAKVSSGEGNTAVGYNSMINLTSGKYNTAVGYNSCNQVTNGKYKTCIGYNSGSNPNSLQALYSSDYERIFIGSSPVNSVDNSGGTKDDDGYPQTNAGAVLEVYNLNSNSSNAAPIPKIGNSSVVINGNLVVRGNSYFEVPIGRQAAFIDLQKGHGDSADAGKYFQKGLVLQVLFDEPSIGMSVWAGYDGYRRGAGGSNENCASCRNRHAFSDMRTSCVCTAVSYSSAMRSGSNTSNMIYGDSRTTNYQIVSDNYPVSTSYDWFTKARNDNASFNCSADGTESPARFHVSNGNCDSCGTYYFDRSIGSDSDIATVNSNTSSGDNNAANVWFQRQHYGNDPYNYAAIGVDVPFPHARMGTGSELPINDSWSCCPVLVREDDVIHTSKNNVLNWRSDRRLKNVGGKFVAGLDEIRRLSVYNYTFKNDKNKLPRVGVIAQDLRLIFPNAVTKDENGYYQIRLDEMLYAAINAVKTLNTKVQNIASKISKDRQRVAQLKKDNAELNAKLDSLADELTKLEATKKD